MLTIGERIKILRKSHHLTQSELAKKIGYTSDTTIAKIEKNEIELSQSKIMAFADYFEVSPAFILGLTEEENAKTYITTHFKGQKKEYYISDAQFNIVESMLKEFVKEQN